MCLEGVLPRGRVAIRSGATLLRSEPPYCIFHQGTEQPQSSNPGSGFQKA
jgi:hypothetical protein